MTKALMLKLNAYTYSLQRTRYTDHNGKGESSSKPPKRLKTESIASSLGSGKSFVALNKANLRRSERQDTYLGHEFAGTNRTTSSEQSEDSEDPNSSEDADDDDTVSPQEEIRSRLKILDNKVRADASDATSWLALVLIQKEVIEMTINEDRSTKHTRGKSSVQKSIAEVQLSVLERAMLAHPHNTTSIPLLMAKLDLAASSRAWDAERLEREWKQAIASCASNCNTSVAMWSSYLSWRISDSATFTFRGTLEFFAEALLSCRGHLFRQEKDSEARQRIELSCLEMIERLVRLMVEADYKERAHGLLQALSELTFRRPSDLAVDTEQAFQISCSHLEDYWDLEEYRLGEAASKGWSTFAETMKEKPEIYLKHNVKKGDNFIPFGSLSKDLNHPHPITRWVALERARVGLRQFPAKETEEADWTTGELEVDPFSFVIFSDVLPFLIPIESTNGKEFLLNLYMFILGAPQMTEWKSSRVDLDHFWPPHLSKLRSNTSWQVIHGTAMQREKVSALVDPFKLPIKQWMTQLSTIFPIKAEQPKAWFSLWCYSDGQKKDSDKAMQLLLEQISQKSSSNTIALTRLALCESVESHKATIKLAKQLLSQDRDNITLWRAFARVERNNGNVQSARTVYKSLLNGEDTLPFLNIACVWADWAELEWEAGKHSMALRILIMASSVSYSKASSQLMPELLINEVSISKLDLLRARRFFDQAGSIFKDGAVFCAALFHYLSQEADDAFDSAMKVFDSFIEKSQDKTHREDIALIQCNFAWRHIYGDADVRRSRVFVPKYITALLTKYVLAFPHNTAFVALLAAFEMACKVENVLRRVLENKMQREEDEIKEQDWLVYIYCELHMSLYSVNENIIRKLFERALEAKR